MAASQAVATDSALFRVNRQHCGIENYLLPTVPNIAEYYKIAAEHQVIVGLRK